MKKVLSLLMTLVLLSSVLLCGGMTALAEEEELVYVPAFSFDFLEEGFEIGGLDDEGLDGENKFATFGNTVGIYFDTAVTSENAFHDKGLKLTSTNGGNGVYISITYALSQTDPKRTDFVGATDFVCYIDTSNWGSERAVRPVLKVNGLDMAGELTGLTNNYFPGDGDTAYIQDANGEWVHPENPVKGGQVDLPAGYKGWVRVPLENFVQTSWDSADANGKLDLDEVISISTEIGCFAKNDGHSIYIDEVGFLGNFEEGYKESFLKDGVVVEVGKEEESSAPETSETESGDETSTPSSDKKIGVSGLVIGLIVAAVVVVVAAVVIILLVLKKAGKKDEPKEEATEETKE